MTPPPSTPKKTRRFTPKIIGHTSPTPRACGTGARNSLRTLAPAAARPSVRPPTGAPGMRGFPRARTSAADRDSRGNCRSTAVSVTLALREQAEAEAALAVTTTTAPITPGRRRARKPGPARTAVIGRPTTPDELPLAHAPAASRPDDPPLRTTFARSEKPPLAAPASQAQVSQGAQAAHLAQASHRSRRRIEPGASPGAARNGEPATRPRPSRVLAELHAALADEAAAAE